MSDSLLSLPPRSFFFLAQALLIDAVRSFAPGFIFTTAIPPSLAAGALASVRYLKESQVERELMQTRVRQVKSKLQANAIPIMLCESHICPVLVGDPKLCKAASDLLFSKHKIYAQPINWPTVPKGTERLRFTPTPFHTEAMIDTLVAALLDVWEELGIAKIPQSPL